MRTRETSVITYHEIENNGLLSKKRLQVYKILYSNGPLTGAQVSRLHGQVYGTNTISETVRNRITELVDLGVVTEVGKGPCPITGREVIIWDVTKNLPTGRAKKLPMKERKKEILQDIVALGERLPMHYKEDLRKIHRKLKEL